MGGSMVTAMLMDGIRLENGIIMLFDRETRRQYDTVPYDTSRFYACAWSRGICTYSIKALFYKGGEASML